MLSSAAMNLIASTTSTTIDSMIHSITLTLTITK